MLLCMLLLLMAVASVVALGIIMGNSGVGAQEALDLMSDVSSPEGLSALRLTQWVYQLVAFLGAALLFAAIYGKRTTGGFYMRPMHWTILLCIPLVFAFVPLVEWSSLFSEWLIPADSALGQWALPLQQQAQEITEALLGGGQLGTFELLLMSAVLPAVCEEFFFRGALQGQLVKTFKNVHLGIWVTAFLFAAIHMEIYGVLPRMLLGAALGYALVYTGSIWAPVLLHMVYNGLALLGQMALWESGEQVSDQGMQTTVGMLLLGSALSVGIILVMRSKGRWKSIRTDYLQFDKQDVDNYLEDRYGQMS